MKNTLPVKFGPDGLIPVVVQEFSTGNVLMLAFMNEEALRLTMETGETHFWSRSRQVIWHKGATSGHIQRVEKIAINCEQNSLLISVQQQGVVCHEGYASCYYRALAGDGTMETILPRQFDPATVYPPVADTSLALWYGAYEYLRDHDLSAQSNTSRLLHDEAAELEARVADELEELMGVLRGAHRHTNPKEDVALEASQALYWLALLAVKHRATFSALRPDLALLTTDPDLPASIAARLAEAEAALWRLTGNKCDLILRIHAAMAVVAQAVTSGGVTPATVIEHDLAEQQKKPYLQPWFAIRSGTSSD